MSKKSAINMGGIGADMPAHLFEIHHCQAWGGTEHLLEPIPKAQEAHAAALKTARSE
jgi:hypothetical protein